MNDNSIMPYGKHKGTKLANVPAQYLIWLYENTTIKDKGLEAYIADNLDVLKQELGK